MNELNVIGSRLEAACVRINTPEFIADDPVQFPRRFSAQADVEIMALLAAMVAWGRRPQILKDCEKLVALMHASPYDYLMGGEWEELSPGVCIHRTCFAPHLQYMLRGLRRIFREYGTLEAFAVAASVPDAEAPAWALAGAMQKVMREENAGLSCSEVIPSNLQTTALKRYNMALRWLVRTDGIVDMGIWTCLKPAQLFIPLDVHVGNTSRSLGLLERKSNDRKAVELLTAALRRFDPLDPVKYDFALFGLGISGADLSMQN